MHGLNRYCLIHEPDPYRIMWPRDNNILDNRRYDFIFVYRVQLFLVLNTFREFLRSFLWSYKVHLLTFTLPFISLFFFSCFLLLLLFFLTASCLLYMHKSLLTRKWCIDIHFLQYHYLLQTFEFTWAAAALFLFHNILSRPCVALVHDCLVGW